jgi:multicomponent Na+:H+ antiporter subunit D
MIEASVAPPLSVGVPLLGAALLTALTAVLPRRPVAAVAVACATATAAICLLLLLDASNGGLVYWFGGWQPRGGVPLGISFAVEPVGAALALLAAVLTVGSLVYSTRYFHSVSTLYHPLVLVFLAVMVGLCLTADLFNLFVFFELMSVSAFALTAYVIQRAAPLQGAINFAITNTIGAFLVLWGIALLYARTGALNLAVIGQIVAQHRADRLIVVAFVLLGTGFLVKAAIVPFHFWLADAYASAPVPINAIFAGVMSELGLYAFARVYWSAFEGALSVSASGVRAVFVGAGVATAIVGAVMCFAQRRLKRLLAFAVVSHAGLFFIGIALLTSASLAGVLVYMVGDGLVKASLFLSAGIVQYRLGDLDEMKLRGRGRRLAPAAVLFVLGGLGLAGMPPVATFLGKGMIEEDAASLGYAWIPSVFTVAAILTGGAVLRAAGRIFAGWGPLDDKVADLHREAAPGERSRTPPSMWVPATVFAVLAVAATAWPQLSSRAVGAAEAFQNRAQYVEQVLHGSARPRVEVQPRPSPGAALGALSAGGAIALALLALFWDRVPDRLRHVWGRPLGAVLSRLRGLHSGHVGDYVTWLTLGVAVYGALIAAAAL